MPTFLNVKNNASSILDSNITAGATSLTVAAGEGARFPATDFHITIDNEIMKCTTRSGDVLTVTRAQEGTAAAAHSQGAAVRLNITAAIIEELKKQLWDADGDTGIQVEESADEDKIRMDVKGVEAFLLHDTGILDLAKQSGARAYRATSVQSIPASTFTKIALNAKAYDIQNEFDSTTNYRFTALAAGLYLAVGTIYYNSHQADRRWDVIIYKNGVNIQSIEYSFTPDTSMSRQNVAFASLAVGNYLELWTYHNCDTAKDVYYGEIATNLTIAKIA